MVWSKWLGSVVVTMAWAGLALSQPPAPAPSGGERIVTLRETGGSARHCRVIASWEMPEGGMATQVQDAQSGEMITVVQNGASKAQRIIHWGDRTTPPPGTPVPPAVVPPPSVVQQSAPMPSAPKSEPAKVETLKADAVPALNPPPKVEAPKAGLPKIETPRKVEAPKVEAPKVELPKIETRRVEAQKVDPPAAAPLIVNGTPPGTGTEKPSLPVIINGPPPSGVKPAQMQVVVQSEEKKAPSTWRESWGKPATASQQGPQYVQPPSVGRQDPQSTPGFFPSTNPRTAIQAQQAPVQQVRPQQIAAPVQPVQPQSVQASPMVRSQQSAAPVQTVQPQTVQATPAETVVPLDRTVRRIPGGMQSVVAAGEGQAQYIPVPIMTAPPMTRIVVPPNPVREPNSLPNEQFVNAFTPPPMPNQVMTPWGMDPRPRMPSGYPNPMANGPMIPMGAMPPAMMQSPMMPPGYRGQMSMSMPVDPTAQHLAMLKNALYPSHREIAAMQLSAFSAQQYPHAVRALLTAAKDDPAATVRAACVNGLMKMQVQSPELVAVLHQLRGDADPRVHQEVEQALARLAPGLPQATEQPVVQPARATGMPTLP
jgi:hypothetical protein